jgi:hypothetical protein
MPTGFFGKNPVGAKFGDIRVKVIREKTGGDQPGTTTGGVQSIMRFYCSLLLLLLLRSALALKPTLNKPLIARRQAVQHLGAGLVAAVIGGGGGVDNAQAAIISQKICEQGVGEGCK